MPATAPKTTHTPGPWKASEYYVNSYDHGWVAKCNVLQSPIENQPQSFHDERAKANARLIAAAPDLLGACKTARSLIFRCGELLNEPFFAELSAIDAAIARATAA